MSSRNIALALVVAVGLSQTGCYSYALRSSARGDGNTEEQVGLTLVYGLVGTNQSAPECTRGFSKVTTSMPWYGGIVASITFGIVMPWRAEYTCVE